jgi:hypothetical protein
MKVDISNTVTTWHDTFDAKIIHIPLKSLFIEDLEGYFKTLKQQKLAKEAEQKRQTEINELESRLSKLKGGQ